VNKCCRFAMLPRRVKIGAGELSGARVDAVTPQVTVIEEQGNGVIVERIEVSGPSDYEVILADGTRHSMHRNVDEAEAALAQLEQQTQAQTVQSTFAKRLN
jgi:hypothetical protein